MNRVILMGRLTNDPEIRRTADGLAIARWTLAVDRFKDGADFPSCNAFGKTAEFAEQYLKKGSKILVEGRIQTGSYEKDGRRIYTTDVVAEHCEFAESKKSAEAASETAVNTKISDGFMNIPDGIDEELPFR